MWAVLLAAAIRIAQALNMHRIGPDPEEPMSPHAQLDREIQKALWLFLCIQDWFFIPFVNAHSVSPAHCTTPLPINCDGIAAFSDDSGTFTALSSGKPTQMIYLLRMHRGKDAFL